MNNERVRKLLPWVSTPLILLVFFIAWEVFVRAFEVSPLVLPPPMAVLESLTEVVADPETWEHAGITAAETVGGFLIALVTGAIVGEYLGGNEGLGYLVVRTLNELNAPALFATIMLLSVLGLGLYFAVNSLKRFVIPWHESVYGQHDVNG